MKIIHVRLARSIWLFDLRDLNPRGKDVLEELIAWIKERFDFKIAPDPTAVVAGIKASPAGQSPSGIVFQKGRFQGREGLFVEISNLTLYNDGIVIDTPSSTLDGDQFAQDLLQSAAQEFALTYDNDSIRKRLYVSELIVRSDLSLDVINPRLAAFAARIGEALPEGSKPQFQIAGVSFWSEPSDAGVHRMFTVEHQSGVPLSEGRYYSQAPLPTHEHFRLLEELEQVMKGA